MWWDSGLFTVLISPDVRDGGLCRRPRGQGPVFCVRKIFALVLAQLQLPHFAMYVFEIC